MRRKFFVSFACAVLMFTASVSHSEDNMRNPQVAGAFYPANPAELSAMIDGFLEKVPEYPVRPGLVTLIVPHAGYVYSGQVAAHGYKLLAGRHFDTVVLIGPCHHALFRGADVWRAGAWRTPLGDVAIDTPLADAILAESPEFQFVPEAHLPEHSLEVQVPFLQKVLRDFKLVPILVSDPRPESSRRLAEAIVKSIKGKNALIVVSTDMSHYHPDSEARPMDQATLELLRKQDAGKLLEQVLSEKSEMCGGAAALTALHAAGLMGGTRLEVLTYANSGDVTGDKSRVVGYGASAIYLNEADSTEPEGELNSQQQRELLRTARTTLESYLKDKRAPEAATQDPALKETRAVFVTLRNRGQLRGCIGRVAAEEPLYLAVRNMAIESATQDPRFPPVTAGELKDLTIEISVLGVPRRVGNADEIKLEKHGVIVRNGGRGGVFLPKVAAETGWSKEEFLNQLCYQKAGLPPDCWKDPNTEIFVFTAQDFGETK